MLLLSVILKLPRLRYNLNCTIYLRDKGRGVLAGKFMWSKLILSDKLLPSSLSFTKSVKKFMSHLLDCLKYRCAWFTSVRLFQSAKENGFTVCSPAGPSWVSFLRSPGHPQKFSTLSLLWRLGHPHGDSLYSLAGWATLSPPASPSWWCTFQRNGHRGERNCFKSKPGSGDLDLLNRYPDTLSESENHLANETGLAPSLAVFLPPLMEMELSDRGGWSSRRRLRVIPMKEPFLEISCQSFELRDICCNV